MRQSLNKRIYIKSCSIFYSTKYGNSCKELKYFMEKFYLPWLKVLVTNPIHTLQPLREQVHCWNSLWPQITDCTLHFALPSLSCLLSLVLLAFDGLPWPLAHPGHSYAFYWGLSQALESLFPPRPAMSSTLPWIVPISISSEIWKPGGSILCWTLSLTASDW